MASLKTEKGVVLTTADGHQEHFDKVIVASHSDAALSMLRNGGGATPQEEKVLGMFNWIQNTVVLHSDLKVSGVATIVDYR